MGLTSGTRLGPYEIVAPIGAGGMGEVYRARDSRLGRDVAVKVLPEAFARDAERLSRFQREAKVLASLNHPNIASIYGFEDSGSVHALVMELVEGPTLADRIARGAIPIEEALPIAKQIAEAVEYAHERGIVHRDLKPANIKLGDNDAVKILDFGLAKALDADATQRDMSSSPTVTHMATQAGIILGTAAYMSPEQAKGKAVDRRTDIWAFGCVLYEMLAGKMAFSGESITETLAAVIREEPDWSLLPANTPPAIRRLLARCLKKDARQRLQSMGDARIAIEEVLSGAPEDSRSSAALGLPILAPLWRRALPWSLVATLTLVAGAAIWRPWHAAPTPPAVAHLTISLQPSEQLFPNAGGLAISPDGAYVAYTSTPSPGGTRQLSLRPMERSEAVLIPGSEDASGPFFSPDSEWIGFTADGKLKKVAVAGGTPIVLCDKTDITSGSWAQDGTIYFFESRGRIMAVSATGGTPQAVATSETAAGELDPRWLELLPGGQDILYVSGGTRADNSDDANIVVQSLKTGERKTLIQGGTSPEYLSTGRLIYAQGGRLLAVPFDLRRLEITGTAVPVVEDVWQGNAGYAAYSVSGDGSLTYINGGEGAELVSSLNRVDRAGAAQRLIDSAHPFGDLSLSPDGAHVAIMNALYPPLWEIWVSDLGRGTLDRLTFSKPGDRAYDPVWTPDGKQVIYSDCDETSCRIMSRPADGSGTQELLFSGNDFMNPMSCSPDGKLLVFARQLKEYNDLWVLTLAGEHKARPLIESSFDTVEAQISPDGRWIAYASKESGRKEVYAQPFPDLGGKWQISTEGGGEPRWSHDGRELFYSNGDKMMVVEIEAQAGFAPGSPRLLFDQPYQHGMESAKYDVAPDGQHFVMLKMDEAQSTQLQLRVVLNWGQEVTQLLGAGTK